MLNYLKLIEFETPNHLDLGIRCDSDGVYVLDWWWYFKNVPKSWGRLEANGDAHVDRSYRNLVLKGLKKDDDIYLSIWCKRDWLENNSTNPSEGYEPIDTLDGFEFDESYESFRFLNYQGSRFLIHLNLIKPLWEMMSSDNRVSFKVYDSFRQF